MTILVTGAAGFIGYHLAERLLSRGDDVLGLDNLNDYYSVDLKRARLDELMSRHKNFRFDAVDLADSVALNTAVGSGIRTIAHLAAQPGVRYSIENPTAYAASNLVGHLNMLEVARHADQLDAMTYASSSSVYGKDVEPPFSETARTDHPISLYAATKRADELMSDAYAHLYRLPLTGLRFFTVYGPWGRPDMAVWKFTQKILDGEPLPLYAAGDLLRDFTYIDDIVTGIVETLDHPNGGRNSDSQTNRHHIYNIGNNRPVTVSYLIELIEKAAGRTALIEDLPPQPGDVPMTCADISAIQRDYGFAPTTSLEEGVERFVSWYRGWNMRSAVR